MRGKHLGWPWTCYILSVELAGNFNGVPEPVARDDGFVLTDAADTPVTARVLMLVAALLLLLPLLIVGVMISNSASMFALIVPGLVLLIGVFVGAAARKRWILTSRWHPGELVLSQWPVPPGVEVRAVFHRRLRRSVAHPEPELFSGLLSCIESVTYQQGTDSRTVTEVLWEQPIELLALTTNDASLGEKMIISIPGDAPPSFELRNNRLRYFLVLEPRGESDVDDSKFMLWVRP